MGTLAAWSTRLAATTLSGRGVPVYRPTHAHVSTITYRVDVYRSRPIVASHSPQDISRDAWQALAGRGRRAGGTESRPVRLRLHGASLTIGRSSNRCVHTSVIVYRQLKNIPHQRFHL